MGDDPWASLQKNFVALSKKLELNETLTSILYQEGFIDSQDYDRLRSSESHSSKVYLLLVDRLPRQSSGRYSLFCECLRKSGQDHVADILEPRKQSDSWSNSSGASSTHLIRKLVIPGQSSDSRELVDTSVSLKFGKSMAISTSSPYLSHVQTSTSLLQASPFQDVDSSFFRSGYMVEGQGKLSSSVYGSGNSLSSLHQFSRGHSTPQSTSMSALQISSGSESHSAHRQVSDQDPASLQDTPPSMVPERRCTMCPTLRRKVCHYKKDIDTKIEQIVQLEEKLSARDDYCSTLEQAVQGLEHESSILIQERSAMIAKFQSYSVAAGSATSISEKLPQWTLREIDTDHSLKPTSESPSLSVKDQFYIIHMSIQKWFAEHGENGTAQQLYQVIAQQGNKQLADNLFS